MMALKKSQLAMQINTEYHAANRAAEEAIGQVGTVGQLHVGN